MIRSGGRQARVAEQPPPAGRADLRRAEQVAERLIGPNLGGELPDNLLRRFSVPLISTARPNMLAAVRACEEPQKSQCGLGPMAALRMSDQEVARLAGCLLSNWGRN